MDSTIQGIVAKKWKDLDVELPVGRTSIDTSFVVRVAGSVQKRENQFVAPTISIPLLATIAYFVDRLGIGKDQALTTLREAVTEAMTQKVEESPAIKAKMADMESAVAAVKRDLIEKLPRLRRSGRVDLDDLLVTVHELVPADQQFFTVNEPVAAAATT